MLQEGRYGQLRLDKNENCAGWSQRLIKDILGGIRPDFLSVYPEPITLYDKISKWHGIENDRLLLTTGSEMAIRYLFEADLEDGDEIVLLDPSFAMFDVYARLCGAKVVPVTFNRDLRISTEDILSHISRRTKIVAIANPNNPTGTVIPNDDLVRIVEKAAKCNVLALIDEAYFHFYGRTMVNYIGAFDNLVVTRTFSKACGAASVRLGYAIGHPEVIAAMNKLQPIDHVNGFAVLVGEYLIEHHELIAGYVRQVENGKALLLKELRKMGLATVNGFGNFVLVDFGIRKDEIVSRLAGKGILLGTHLKFPFRRSNYVRVTVGPPNQMKRFSRALLEAMA
jgi:histidinol-phosphate aminotransferase